MKTSKASLESLLLNRLTNSRSLSLFGQVWSIRHSEHKILEEFAVVLL